MSDARATADVLATIVEIAAGSDIATIATSLAAGAHELFGTDAEVSVDRRDRRLAHARKGAAQAEAGERRFTQQAAATQVSVALTLGGGSSPEASQRAESQAPALVAIATAGIHKLCLVADARDLARDRQEIVSVLSHDLRTPLQSLGLGLDALDLLLAGTLVAAPCASTIKRMQRAVAAMGRLLGDLLDVSRIHDGALSIHVKTCDASKLVSDVAEQHAPLAATRGFALQVSSAGAGSLVCDAGRVTQALSNLLSNAIRHADRGPIQLRALRQGERVRFEVEDAGPGIPDEVRARLFDRLYRPNDEDGRRGGLGLGLYIAKGIVAAHGGTIGVDSEVGRGSTFWIELQDRPSVAARRDADSI
jgi:signal transduction histidine kinase